MMRFFCRLFCLLLPTSVYAIEDNDFWLMMDADMPNSTVSINSGKDNEGTKFYGGYIDLAMGENTHFNLAGSKQEFEGEGTAQWSLGFGHILQNEFSWDVNYAWWGDVGVLETRNLMVDLSYFKERWSWLLGLEKGELEIHGLSLSTKIDHDAYELGFGYSNTHMYWDLSYKKHDYSLDLRKLDFPLIAFILRPLLLHIITPGAQQQASALADSETSLRIGWVEDEYIVEANYQLVESAVTAETDAFIGLSISKQLTSSFNIKVELGHVVDNGPTSAGVTLIYSW